MALVLFVLFLALKVIADQSYLSCLNCDGTVLCKVRDDGALVCDAPTDCNKENATACVNSGNNTFDCAVTTKFFTPLTAQYTARSICRDSNPTEVAEECELKKGLLNDTCKCQVNECNRQVVFHGFTTLVPVSHTPVPSTLTSIAVMGSVPSTLTSVSVVADPSVAPESTFVDGELKSPFYFVFLLFLALPLVCPFTFM